MIINHNMNAMNAHRNMMSTTGAQGKSMEKLSSGIRINRAGDDAAGLAISENMRSQIRGLNQASRNSQDGVSMIQTAEGALGETQSIAQRMRELAVQSANGIYTDEDRALIDQEFQQLSDEIDRIASDTEFNGKAVLGGKKNTNVSPIEAKNTATGITEITGLPEGEYDIAIDTGGGTITVKDSNGNTVGSATGVSVPTAGNTSDIDLGNGIVVKVDENLVTNLAAEYDTIFPTPENALTGVTESKGLPLGEFQVDIDMTAGTITMTDIDGNIIGSASDVTTPAAGEIKEIDLGNGIKFTIDENIVDASTTVATQYLPMDVELQVGASEGQRINFKIDRMDNETLGLTGVNVADVDSAQTAITSLDDAITQISEQRADLGAVQNRLESTISSTDNTAENIQAAESRIRDVDMAKEMMNLTKLNVLQQASQAMLAQAKSAPEQVLQLLR